MYRKSVEDDWKYHYDFYELLSCLPYGFLHDIFGEIARADRIREYYSYNGAMRKFQNAINEIYGKQFTNKITKILSCITTIEDDNILVWLELLLSDGLRVMVLIHE